MNRPRFPVSHQQQASANQKNPYPQQKSRTDFTTNDEPESKTWTLEKQQKNELRANLEQVLRGPSSPSARDRSKHEGLSAKDQTARSTSAPPDNQETVEGQEHLLRPSAIKAHQPKLSPEQLKAVDMRTIHNAIKNIRTGEDSFRTYFI